MGKVLPFKKSAVNSETAELLAELTAQEKRGELHGFLPIWENDRGTHMRLIGSFTDQLQFAGYTLIKCINVIADKIAESGTAGHTKSGPIREEWPSPKRMQPKRLREATGFSEID